MLKSQPFKPGRYVHQNAQTWASIAGSLIVLMVLCVSEGRAELALGFAVLLGLANHLQRSAPHIDVSKPDQETRR